VADFNLTRTGPVWRPSEAMQHGLRAGRIQLEHRSNIGSAALGRGADCPTRTKPAARAIFRPAAQ